MQHARLLVCTIPDHVLKGTNNFDLLKALKKLAPESQVVVTADSAHAARHMYENGADYVFIPRMVGAHYLADVLERIQSDGSAALREKAMAHLLERKEVVQ